MTRLTGIRAQFHEWRVESLRLTHFFHQVPQVNLQNIYNQIVGMVPTQNTAIPAQLGEGFVGDFEGGKLALSRLGNRIDWFLSPNNVVQAGPPTAQINMVGPAEPTITQFTLAMNAWLNHSPTCARVAFGADLLLPVASREIGYERISSYLDFDLDAATSSDFIYNINRKRRTTTPITDLCINRISKWAVLEYGFALIQQNGVVLGTTRGADNQRMWAIKISLDMNTSQDFPNEFTSQQQTQLFTELTGLAWEIVNEGEVP